MKNLYKNVLSSKTYTLLNNILTKEAFSDFYLVGGSALALYLGHRKSLDLDLFSQKEFRANITQKLRIKYQVISLHNNSIELSINGTKVFLFYFAFPLYKKVNTINSIKLADPIDIGLMKLLSFQGRNQRKDIIDLYFIDKHILKLEKLLDLFEEVYPKESFNSYDSLKSLIDVSQLEKQPMPEMILKSNWNECLELVQGKIMKHVEKVISS